MWQTVQMIWPCRNNSEVWPMHGNNGKLDLRLSLSDSRLSISQQIHSKRSHVMVTPDD